MTPDDIVNYLHEYPESTSEDIRASLGGRRADIEETLALLRAERRVKYGPRDQASRLRTWLYDPVGNEEPPPDGGESDEVVEPEVALDDMTVGQLRDLARDRDIEGRSGMNKDALIEALRES